MSYTVNWAVTKVVSIPTSDLTLVSGTRYKLFMNEFLAECRRLEWEPNEGLWAPNIVEHTDTKTDFAGADYAPFDEIVNGYTIEFTGVATRVDLIGSNNNIIDVLVDNGVSVVPSNSAGLIVKAIGSGLSTEQDQALTDAKENTILLKKIAEGDEKETPLKRYVYEKGTTTKLLEKDITGSNLASGSTIQTVDVP